MMEGKAPSTCNMVEVETRDIVNDHILSNIQVKSGDDIVHFVIQHDGG